MSERKTTAEMEVERMDEDERQRVLHEQRGEVATRIAEQLGETEEEPRKTIYKIVKKLGTDEALRFMQKTLEVEAAGGIMVPDQSRRRTIGGVFFYLVKTEAPPEITKHIFRKKIPIKKAKPQKEQAAKAATTPAPEVASPAPPFTWADRIAVLAEIPNEERGEVRSVKITLIGRPGRIVERGQCIITTMQQQTTKLPPLPKGLPIPAPDQIEPTLFAVYIAVKQWNKVAEAINDPEDVLIVEGIQLLDKKLPNAIAVFASNVTTKKLQATQRQTQSQK